KQMFHAQGPFAVRRGGRKQAAREYQLTAVRRAPTPFFVALSFDVAHRFDDTSATDPHQIDATDGLTLVCAPAIAPSDDDPLTDDKHFLACEPGACGPGEILPVRQACRLANQTGAVWSGMGILDDAIIRNQVLHRIRIVTIECLMKFSDDLRGHDRRAVQWTQNGDLIR